MDELLIGSLPNLKVVGNNAGLKACKSRGIRVGYTPDVLSAATADMGWALLLAAARRVVEGNGIIKDSRTTVVGKIDWLGWEVCTTTLGIIGLGRIGKEVARRAKGFEMEGLYHNRTRQPTEVEEELSATYVESLEELLSRSDHVVLVAPATPSTYRMMGKAQFAAMKKTATFVNISRGSLVDQDALVEALKNRSIAAAGLDVTEPEPLPRDHPSWS